MTSTNTPRSYALIDSHVHVFKQDMPLLPNPRHSPDYSFTAQQLESTLTQHGVQQCVIAAASPWGDYNDYIVQTLSSRAHWRGTAILEPHKVSQMELQALDGAGIVGVRLPFISLSQLPDLSSWDYRKFLYRLADMDWHVHLHLDGPRIPQVLPALLNSGVKIVIDHMARPDPQKGIACEGFQAVLRAAQSGRCWVKLSAGYRLQGDTLAYARELLAAMGPERLLWASDCPFVGVESTTYQSTIDWFEQAVTDPAQRQQIGYATPTALYFMRGR